MHAKGAHLFGPIFQKSKNAKNCTKEAAQSSNPFHLNPKGEIDPRASFWPIFQKSKNAKNCTKEDPQSSNPFHSNPKGGNRPSRIFLGTFSRNRKTPKTASKKP